MDHISTYSVTYTRLTHTTCLNRCRVGIGRQEAVTPRSMTQQSHRTRGKETEDSEEHDSLTRVGRGGR